MPKEKSGTTLPCFYGTEVIKEAFANIAEFGKIPAPVFCLRQSDGSDAEKKSEYAEVMSTESSSISGVREIRQPVQDTSSWYNSTKETDLFLPLKMMMILGHLSQRPSAVHSERYYLLATSLPRPQKVPLPSMCSQGLARLAS